MTGLKHSTKQSVTIEAKRWVVKLDELTPIEHKRLERWLKESAEHREAFATAKHEWQSLEFLQQLRKEPVTKGDPWVAKRRIRRKRNRRYALPLAMAATAAAMALTIGWSLWPGTGYQAEYYTAVGEQQEISLPDGSSILLNTSTSLNIQYSGEQRNVFLDAGEAHFDVAHDSARPFVVITSVGVVRAVGTAFTVHVHDEKAEVTVTDGRVQIAKAPENLIAAVPTAELPDSGAGAVQTLAKGYNATISETIEEVAAVDTEVLERKLSWQYGMLEFVNTPLGEVIDEVGRYTPKTLVIEDPELANYPVTIIARTDNIDGLLSNLDISTAAFSVTHTTEDRVLISTP
ncbi:MAG: FecR domain-containing protein [Pseudomonadota bacterium]